MDSRGDQRTLTAEEEAIKLNTDCVYFLASPLTCKKGSECEYRHSEEARLNPRDCRFWLSGNCLNPKCLFRHPPLDGMVASPRPTSGKIFPFSHVPQSAQMANSFAYNFGRNNVPCYYYLKGACLKGDKCAFMHGPPPVANPVAKQSPNVSAQISTQTETPEQFGGKINEPNNQQNLPTTLIMGNVSSDKQVNGSPSLAKGVRALENAPVSRNGIARSQTTYDPDRSSSSYSSSQNLHVQPERHLLHGSETGEIFEESSGVGYTELERSLSLNHQLQSPSEDYQDTQAAEEVFRDSSPGFDVLVDHVVRDTDYFHGNDGFRSGSQGRRMNQGDDYDHYHSDYESSTRFDGFQHDGAGEFLYGNEHYGDDWDRHKISATFDRMMVEPLRTDRSLARRLRSPDKMDASDLRHRLRKQSRQDGSFSATSSVRYREPYRKHDNKNIKDRYHKPNSYRDQQLHGRAISSRLRARMTLPKPPSSEIISDLHDGWDKGRRRVRLSPAKPSGNHRSLGQRLDRRPHEESFVRPRFFDRQQRTRDAADLLDFAGPKSLEELKGAKADRNSEPQSIKHNPSNSALEHNRAASMKASQPRDSSASVDFEGPMPLSVLLKRKRESGSENDAKTVLLKRKREFESKNNAKSVVESEVVSGVFAPANLEVTEATGDLGEPKVGTFEKSLIHTEEEQKDAGEETEAKNAIEGEEDPEYTDQKDGEYYYNDDVDHIDEDLDAEDDEDDFAKKIGLIFSS